MKSRILVPATIAGFGIVIFLIVTVISKLYPSDEVPVQVTGAFLGAIVTAAITMVLLHGQSQAEEAKERNVKVFEEKTKRYHEFIQKLWTVWQDRQISFEELNDLLECVSRDIIIFTKESSTEKILDGLSKIALYAGKPYLPENEKMVIQKEIFEIINVLSAEMNLGGSLNEKISANLAKIESAIRPMLDKKAAKKILAELMFDVLNSCDDLPGFSTPKYMEYYGNEYLLVPFKDSPINVMVGPVENRTETGGYLICICSDSNKVNEHRQKSRGFHWALLGPGMWSGEINKKLTSPMEEILNLSSPDSCSKICSSDSELRSFANITVDFLKNWKSKDLDVSGLIYACRALQ